MTEPYLRRGPVPEAGRNGRKLVIGLVVFLAILVVAVLVPLLVIGLHNSGTKTPPDEAPVRVSSSSTP